YRVRTATAAQAGFYSVRVANDAGAVFSSDAQLTVRVPPIITQQPTTVAVRPGSNATFSVTALGDAPLVFRWFFNGTNALANATNATLSLSNVQPAQEGTYGVVVSTSVGVASSATASLLVRQPPSILQQPTSLTATQGQSVQFSVIAGGDGPFTYQWFLNGTN